MINIKDADFLLNLEKKDNYLYAFASGPKDTLEIAKRMWGMISTKTKELGFKAVLVEEDFPNQISAMDMYQIGEFIAENFKGIKIAHVDRHLSDAELNEFGETVVVNRGVIGKIFNNITDAEKWVKQ